MLVPHVYPEIEAGLTTIAIPFTYNAPVYVQLPAGAMAGEATVPPLMLVEMELDTADAEEGPTVLMTVYVTDALA